MSSGDEEFERGLEGASIEGLNSLSGELDEEESRLRRLYGEARGSEQRRLIKSMIRQVAANSGSVEASIAAHKDNLKDRPPTVKLLKMAVVMRKNPQPEHPVVATVPASVHAVRDPGLAGVSVLPMFGWRSKGLVYFMGPVARRVRNLCGFPLLSRRAFCCSRCRSTKLPPPGEGPITRT
jgi:hypothetical protein